jgi:hypothetical protein
MPRTIWSSGASVAVWTNFQRRVSNSRCRPAGTDKQSERDGSCRFTSRESTANRIVVENNMHPVFRDSGILRMQRCQLGGELGLGVIAQRAGLCCNGVERHIFTRKSPTGRPHPSTQRRISDLD